MPTYDPDNPSGRGDGFKKSTDALKRVDVAAEIGVPALLETLARGPWRAEWAVVPGTTQKRRHFVRHTDGRVLAVLMPKDRDTARLLATQANGWETARGFPPAHPERWRTQNALPALPTRGDVRRALTAAQAALREGSPAWREVTDVLAEMR